MTSLEMLKVTTAPVPVSRERFASRIPLASTGIQSYIEVGEVDGVPAIRKVSGRELSTDTISTLLPIFPEYRKSLIHAGLCLPASLSVHACNGGIELVDEYVEGRDIDVMIRIKDPRTQQAWMEMIKQLCRANDGAHQSQAMIDAKPANFIISNDVLFYVDFFPPMLMDTDGMITPWVPEIYKRDHRMMSFNFGDTRGQITKLLAGSQLEYPDMYQHLETWTLQAIEGKLSDPTLQYIHEQVRLNFPDMHLFYSGKNITQRMGELKK